MVERDQPSPTMHLINPQIPPHTPVKADAFKGLRALGEISVHVRQPRRVHEADFDTRILGDTVLAEVPPGIRFGHVILVPTGVRHTDEIQTVESDGYGLTLARHDLHPG